MSSPLKLLVRCASLIASSFALFIFPQSQVQVGYALLLPDAGTQIPVATALFTYTNSSGILVSQAGVAATEPIYRGRIFVDQDGTETGIALVNPSSRSAAITIILRNASGSEVNRQSITLDPGKHLGRFVSEIFRDLPTAFSGSASFESTEKLAAITLRQSKNAQGEVLYATLPVVDLSLPGRSDPLVFPQIAAGEGYTTQLILINVSDQTERGQVDFYGDDGNRISMHAGGIETSQVNFQIAPNGTQQLEVEASSGLKTGYAVVTPDPGDTSPGGSVVFRYKKDGVVITEAGVGATALTTSARTFVDNAGSYTGVALVNRENQASAVTFTLLDRNGQVQQTARRTLPPGGHLAAFAHELFAGLGDKYAGLMEISSTTPVAAITLKLVINARGDLIYTTLPVADMNQPLSATAMVFPQIAFGGGFSTRLICISLDKVKEASGKLTFYQSNSEPMPIPFGSQVASQFPYQLPQGGGIQLFPGSTARIASIAILDPQTNRITREIAVNEGNSIKAPLLVLDETGMPRDDFALSYSSINPEVATVDANGNVTGKKAGFSTITIISGGVVATGTINVVRVKTGSSGSTNSVVIGVALDLGRRLYLAASQEHTILLAEELGEVPVLYAGTRGSGGLKNDLRLKSLFRNPEFVALDQARGTLYVSDEANHVIRRIQAGPDGVVETFAGTGEKGSSDGSPAGARFNDPQGVALDNRGYLWVVDSGNHTIRRINLSSGVTETVAGKAGSSGWADGKGDQARFNTPVGIAVEPDLAVVGILSATTKPVSVIVADTGNGLIRRVKSSGEVETIQEGGSTGAALRLNVKMNQQQAAPIAFNSPTGVAVDPFGNIYVSEPGSRRVSVILGSGEIVGAAQAKTFQSPMGMAVIQSGRVVVADGTDAAGEIAYGEPQITSITPVKISVRGGEKVVIKGANFASDSYIVIAGTVVAQYAVRDTQTIEFTAPMGMASGLVTLSVQSRSGLAQRQFFIEPVPLSELPSQYITTIAGGATYSGGGSLAVASSLEPSNVAVDPEGNFFITDIDARLIRRVSATTGIITVVVGNGVYGDSGDGGPATAASLTTPGGIAIDAGGNLFIADSYNHKIRKVNSATGIITTIAGNGRSGYSGDNGPAAAAQLNLPTGMATDGLGNLFISDNGNNRIRKITFSTGIITTVAGGGSGGLGDNGPATSAQLSGPARIALDAVGNLLIAETGNNRIRKVNAQSGVITTVAGNGEFGYGGDGGPATAAQFTVPLGITIGREGDLYITDVMVSRIRKVSASTGIITTFAGTFPGFSGDGGPAGNASLDFPEGIAFDSAGNLFIADLGNNRVRKVSVKTGVLTTVAGDGQYSCFSGDNGPAAASRLWGPLGVAVDSGGNVYFSDTYNRRVRMIAAKTAVVTTVAGSSSPRETSYAGDKGPATAAKLAWPTGLAAGVSGELLIADTDSYAIRKVGSDGIITTVAGGNNKGYSGDNGPATSAQLMEPVCVALDRKGNYFIVDQENQRIRKVNADTGIITTVAGNGMPGFSGDDGPGASAQLAFPHGAAADSAGNLLIADTANHRIRRIDAGTGKISTIAGTGQAMNSGDAGLATRAGLYSPYAIAVDGDGNVFVASYVIRRIDAKTGIITTVAGGGEEGHLGDNGLAISADFYYIDAMAVDSGGTLYLTDLLHDRIRAIRGPIR